MHLFISIIKESVSVCGVLELLFFSKPFATSLSPCPTHTDVHVAQRTAPVYEYCPGPCPTCMRTPCNSWLCVLRTCCRCRAGEGGGGGKPFFPNPTSTTKVQAAPDYRTHVYVYCKVITGICLWSVGCLFLRNSYTSMKMWIFSHYGCT